MDTAASFWKEITPFWASVGVAYVAFLSGIFYGKIYLGRNALSPKLQPLLVWNSRLHALFLIWYSAALLEFLPSTLMVSGQNLQIIYWANRLYLILDLDSFSIPASKHTQSIPNLKFLDEKVPFPWMQLIPPENPPSLVWRLFAALDEAHWVLVYSYLGRIWGRASQGDQDLPGKRKIQYSRKAHITVGILADMYCLYTRSWEAHPADRVWMRRLSFALLTMHLHSSVTSLVGVGIIDTLVRLFSRSGHGPHDTSVGTTYNEKNREQQGAKDSDIKS